MYQVEYSQKVLDYLTAVSKENPKIIEALQNLEDNPLGNAKFLGYPAIGSYYIEADDKHGILFNIDEEKELICLKSVRRLSYIEGLIRKKP